MNPSWQIQIVRSIWTQMWQTMMGRLAPANDGGEYQRPQSQFDRRIERSMNARYPPATGRYRLYVGWSCPWAHRTLLVRALKGLEAAIPVTVVNGDANAGGWVLPAAEGDCRTLMDIYRLAAPEYNGRATVPVLWDEFTRSIVNNESADIIELLDREFNDFAVNPDCHLAPANLQTQITEWNRRIYPAINNGVYRCGFARSQMAFDRAHSALFELLHEIDIHLADNTYLCGDRLTLADVRLFPTLIRFDLVYYHLFKCNYLRIQDYRHLHRYTCQIFQTQGIPQTCNFLVTLRDYYYNLFPLNPGGIVPPLPDLTYLYLD